MNTDPAFFESELGAALDCLRCGGTLLYPTDTVWGLGCSALDAAAIDRIYTIKKRPDSKSLIVLVASERDILQYVAAPDLEVFTFMQQQERPTTVIFDGALGLPDNLVAADGSIAIRITRDPFCRALVKRLRAPLVSTSANVSGEPAAAHFSEVSEAIRQGVDHIVRWRQDDVTAAQPSQIIRWEEGAPVFLRK
ncbi:L-threonylcarbamoyladenylate synthase [Flaviaesturariibacter aridisoli]|uniref:L-threonylcarbamoyladenylate synthase n=1 Tax=Flaviaesturariibacter aridisoli TaxID=2545761 RepID=A0A4R4E6K6_9BACT|nr:L-threonylcarbamoyladenylate synthase [Flaviaesturariibacter aridisoli]TCZ73325.1 threonylcarbamoyl-AMP synthase [Flaviaesturariibacter aridisoli]